MVIPVGGFKNADDLRAWLYSLPATQRVPFARVIAHRMALRVLPLVGRAFTVKDLPEQEAVALTMTVFRSNAISRVARTSPTREIERAAAAAYAAAAAAAAAAAYAAAAAAATPPPPPTPTPQPPTPPPPTPPPPPPTPTPQPPTPPYGKA